MNTIIRIYQNKILFLFVAGILCLAGCSDSFLERTPSDFIGTDEVFSNIENAEAFLNNAYRNLPEFQRPTENDGGRFKTGAGTDESGYQQSSTETQIPYDFNNGNWNAVAFPMQRCWHDYYSSIRRINVFIENYDKIPEEVSSGHSTKKSRLLGEAYGLRGYYYFELFRMWGGVPLISTPLEPGDKESAYLARNTVEEMIEFITNDLNRAIEILPATHNDSEYGRCTSVVAYSMLSRLYLYYASLLWNPDDRKDRWEKAADYSKKALEFAERNGHALSMTDSGDKKAYERIFLELNNPEVIWAKNSPGETIFWGLYAAPLGYGGWYVSSPLQEMVDSYEMTNGELPVLGYDTNENQIVNPRSGYDPQNPFVNRDPRFYQSILYHGAWWQGRPVDISTGGLDNVTIGAIPRVNYFMRKYLVESHNLYTHEGNTFRRFAIIRLAELYLNYAEALNETSGPVDEVYNLVNIIRKRVDMPELPRGLNKEGMRDRIRQERKIELAFEEHRFWDVRRWKIAEVVDRGKVHKVAVDEYGHFTYPVFQTRIFDEKKHYLFPIPQSELDKNPNMVQNPGW